MIEPGLYRHFKGGLYTVVGEATDSETEQRVVVYSSADGRLWVRPASMWEERVNHQGATVARFTPVELGASPRAED
ncbi:MULTISPECIES: DUF1653 domain-containing protein [unclassified Leifsonia]|uniref:DUF1653 domain-containing protein n=1 Tax=unclassified Leifsonia TaxID=2663824 RepID=UPI0006FE64D7|nr:MULTISPECIES: DUF1653 domain-containing protein [unclassified Leifsonia]KQX07303.1 hypothetical protein ASC59_05850 [Leifsonia sp. Root1293]KRA11586.1 hypothetical protein ASD61_05850 [Leifsonia sp. Root60]